MDNKPAQHNLHVSVAAQDDLRTIYMFGLERWGEKRTEKYLTDIKQQFKRLLANPLIGRIHLNLNDIYCISVKSHKLFYRVNGARVEIIRILHRRQDVESSF